MFIKIIFTLAFLKLLIRFIRRQMIDWQYAMSIFLTLTGKANGRSGRENVLKWHEEFLRGEHQTDGDYENLLKLLKSDFDIRCDDVTEETIRLANLYNKMETDKSNLVTTLTNMEGVLEEKIDFEQKKQEFFKSEIDKNNQLIKRLESGEYEKTIRTKRLNNPEAPVKEDCLEYLKKNYGFEL